MKKLLAAIFVFTALTFLALPMGDVAQSQPGKEPKVSLKKGFTQDDNAWAEVEKKKRETPDKVFGEMEIEAASGNIIKIAFTNPCTTVCVGGRCYLKCY